MMNKFEPGPAQASPICGNNPRAVLLLADQPFQLLLMAEVSKKLRKNGQRAVILLTDLFTFNYGPGLIERVSGDFGLTLLTFESEYRSWQAKGEPNDLVWAQAKITLSRYAKLSSCGRDLETIRKTDPNTNGFEFSKWYRKTSKKWEDVSHAQIIERCETILKTYNPCLIVSIDNCQFPTNVIHALSQGRTRFLTFQDSRIGRRWVPRFNLAYGSHKLTSPFLLQIDDTESKHLEAMKFLNSFVLSGDPLYQATDILLATNYHHEKTFWSWRATKMIINEIKFLSIHFPRSVITGPFTRKFRTRRFDQNHLRIQTFELKRRLKQMSPDFGESVLTIDKPKFFFYALHYRPEGSGLVLGNGEDEFTRIIEICEVLANSNLALVVKEHPMMYGTRYRADLKMLSKIPNLRFAKRFSNSREWIKHALGVIGISGTVLLEATMLGKPAFALGKPEFLDCVFSDSDFSLSSFVTQCTEANLQTKRKELLDYLSLILANSSEFDTPLKANQSWEKMETDINRMTGVLLDLVDNDAVR